MIAQENTILSSLSLFARTLIEPKLETICLPVGHKLEQFGRDTETVYFLDSGVATMVMGARHKDRLEVGLVGREGITGLSVLFGATCSHYDTYMQSAGMGRRMLTFDLYEIMDESPSIRRVVMDFAHSQVLQMASTSRACGRSRLPERLARRLLMMLDRSDSCTLQITHSDLAFTLGVRRPGITVALGGLERSGAVQLIRGGIVILDRVALESAAIGCYGAPEKCFRPIPSSAETALPDFSIPRIEANPELLAPA